MWNWWFDVVLLAAVVALLGTAFRLNRLSKLPAEELQEREIDDWNSSGFWLFPRTLIRQCGIIPSEFGLAYWGCKSVFAVFLPLSLAEFGLVGAGWYVYAVAGTAGFFGLDAFLLQYRRKRKAKIAKNLSYFVDLLVAFLRSGLTLPESFERAAEFGLESSNPLAWEVKLVSYELAAGLDRDEGFQKLAERTGVTPLHRLAAVLIVGTRSGSSVAGILHGQAKLLREQQWEKGEELINRKSLETLVPMALISIPLLMVLIFFPAGVQLLEALSLFREAFF